MQRIASGYMTPRAAHSRPVSTQASPVLLDFELPPTLKALPPAPLAKEQQPPAAEQQQPVMEQQPPPPAVAQQLPAEA